MPSIKQILTLEKERFIENSIHFCCDECQEEEELDKFSQSKNVVSEKFCCCYYLKYSTTHYKSQESSCCLVCQEMEILHIPTFSGHICSRCDYGIKVRFKNNDFKSITAAHDYARQHNYC